MTMLKSLYIKNYALVDELRVQFNSGLNIITGETGTGKSIIVGALGVILGDKFTRDVLRKDAERAILEAEFNVAGRDPVLNFCKDQEIDCFDSVLIIRRELNDTGRSRNFVNDSPVTMPVLEELGNLLVDLHGQHQHQLLLQSFRHISYLDEFAGLGEQVREFRKVYQEYQSLRKELDDLLAREQEMTRARQVHEFQLQEIKAVNPVAGEEEELLQEEKILKNSETLFDTTQALFNALYDQDDAAYEQISHAVGKLDHLADIDPVFSRLRDECENASIIIQETAKALGDYNSKINFDPDRLEEIRQRTSALNGLKKKYGGSVDTVLTHQAFLEKEIDRIENLDSEISGLRKALERLREALKDQGLDISAQRRQASATLGDQVTGELASLGMGKAGFKVNTEYNFETDGKENGIIIDGQPVKIGGRGLDVSEFLISANPGEDFKPLSHVASGGEISRVMLALKTLLAEADQVPVLIFDEIDIGISGRIAQAVGRTMRKLARSHQIICITHLPQIASSGHHHFLVEKQTDGHSTTTTIRALNEQERVEQIARLIGGESLSDAHLTSATELLKESEYAE